MSMFWDMLLVGFPIVVAQPWFCSCTRRPPNCFCFTVPVHLELLLGVFVRRKLLLRVFGCWWTGGKYLVVGYKKKALYDMIATVGNICWARLCQRCGLKSFYFSRGHGKVSSFQKSLCFLPSSCILYALCGIISYQK